MQLEAAFAGDGSCKVWDLEEGKCAHDLAWNSGGTIHAPRQNAFPKATDCFSASAYAHAGVNLCALSPKHPCIGNKSYLLTCHIDAPRREVSRGEQPVGVKLSVVVPNTATIALARGECCFGTSRGRRVGWTTRSRAISGALTILEGRS
jgi:hypothetical protein